MNWEYGIEDFGQVFNRTEVEKRLNELGEMGWELVAVNPSCTTYFFKRDRAANRTSRLEMPTRPPSVVKEMKR